MTNPPISPINSPTPPLVKKPICSATGGSGSGKKGSKRGGLREDYGFTLLELMISIAIIGIIILIISGAMRLGLRSIDSGEKRVESLERIRASLNIIDSQIQSEIPLTYVEDVNTKYYFKGEREFMQFSTNYSIWGGEKGYVIVTYTVEPGENGKQVLYASENLVGLETKRDTKLFDSFEKIYFEYFFKDPTEEEGKWVEQWTDDANIPEKVRLHLIEGTRDLSITIPFRARGSLSQTPSGSTGLRTSEEE
jgi:general secretion pathway protein J